MYKSKLEMVNYAKCPYYGSENCKSITCRDDLDNASRVVTFRFKDDAAKEKHAKEYCYNYPNNCMIFKSLEEEQH